MQFRLNQNDVTNRVNVEDPAKVRDAVLSLFAARFPGSDFTPLARAFDDFKALFEGDYPGYLAKRSSESAVENGAVFTKVHVSRSADFVTAYLPILGFAAEAPTAAKLVHFTGYEMEIDDIQIPDARDRLLGCMVGTADLLGQISDRMYLEKCREFLYREFVLGSIARETGPDGREIVRYSSPDDLILKTPGFYEYVARTRIENKLGGVDRYAEAHFEGANPYQAEIDRNMGFLREAIQTADLKRLRRACYSLSEKKVRAA
jgi:hypothetical protein